MQEQYIHIDTDGDKYYYKDKAMTMLHRTDGPAVEYTNGYKAWWVDGKRHRLDGPAFEWFDGHKEWYVDGKRHRLNGPAYERANGYKAWYVDDKLHRTDGPAIERVDGSKAWYVDGKELTEKQFNVLTAPTLELTLDQIAAEFGVDASKLKIKK
jgi:hypothetical protein